MNALVELIKKIGIFMIAAQAVIHFAPDIKYAKYMKLIVGIMVLLQFLSPIYGIVSGMEADFEERVLKLGQELDAYGGTESLSDSYSASETVAMSMEKEIKTRLNNYLSGEETGKNYVVTSVTIDLERTEESNENAAEYTFHRVRVVVWEHTEASDRTENVPDTENTDDINRVDKVEKIQVDKIGITENDLEENKNEITDGLRKRFCSVLGMEEKYMEVVVYGAY